MNLNEYNNIFLNESTHFFYLSTHNLILSLLKRFTPSKKIIILDAGAGTGLLAQRLQKYGSVKAVDISKEAVTFSKKRKIDIQQASISELPFKDKLFDVITCVDVLYHLTVKDDTKALSELHRVLKPGGVLIMRVPAHPWLSTNHDAHVHTRHRYTAQELSEKAGAVGFNIELLSYVHFLFIPFVLIKKMSEQFSTKKIKSESGVQQFNPVLNKILYLLVSWEKFIIPYIQLPVGVGIIAVLKKN